MTHNLSFIEKASALLLEIRCKDVSKIQTFGICGTGGKGYQSSIALVIGSKAI